MYMRDKIQERRVDGPTMKRLRGEKAVRQTKFYLSGLPFEEVASAMKVVGGNGLAVYLAIRLSCRLSNPDPWSPMPKNLREMLPVDSATYSRIVRKLEARNLIRVKREPGKKLKFALVEDLES